MSKQKFTDWNPQKATLDTLIEAVNIINTYSEKGYKLSLRQIYYQFVSHNLFPEDRRWTWIRDKSKWVRDPDGTKNADPNYKWLGTIIGKGRLAGLIDWDVIEDRGRSTSSNPHWEHPGQAMQTIKNIFAIDKWENQEHRVFVLVEKDALSGVLEPVCRDLDVVFAATKGYSSLSHLHNIAGMIREYDDTEQSSVVLYFGDHDPSGMNMDDDLVTRLEMFSNMRIDFQRIALTMPQIEIYNPPPDPAKMTDSRAKKYVSKYGPTSWELDALDPTVLGDLVEEHVLNWRDPQKWEEKVEEEEVMKEKLEYIADNWEEL